MTPPRIHACCHRPRASRGGRAVDDTELLFAGGETALARRRKCAARVGPNLVNRAAIVTAEVFAPLVFLKNEHELAVVTLGKRRPRQVSASPFLEASDILIFELDPVVLAAGAARQTIEIDRARRPRVNRVTLGSLAHNPIGIVRHPKVGEPGEGAASRSQVLRTSQVEDRPPSEVALVAGARPGEDEPRLAR